MNPVLQLVVGYVIIAICAGGAIYGGYLANQGHTRKNEMEQQKITTPPLEKQYLVPELALNLFQMPFSELSRYQPPLVEYKFIIDNKNRDSLQIKDCRIQFFFKHLIQSIVQEPLVYRGQGIAVSGVKFYSKDQEGNRHSYEEKPLKNTLTDNFSIEIEKTNINDITVNTNIAMFTCSSWPKDIAFAGSIILDSSTKLGLTKLPQNAGTYEGTCYYQIDNKFYKLELNGTIPDIKK